MGAKELQVLTPRRVGERNLGKDGRAFARFGLDGELASDHFHPFSHAEQSQSVFLFAVQQVFPRKAFAVVFYSHANVAVQFLNLHFRPAGLRMAGDIGQRFLRDAKEHRSFGRVHLFHRRKGRQMSADPGPRGKCFHE